MGKIKVLVVDDSAFMRQAISSHLAADPDIEVVGSARDGQAGLEAVRSLQPDVVTLDIEMPRMDGLTALRQLMSERPLPVIMVSALTEEGAAATVEALRLGAIDFVHKPSGSISLDFHRVKEDLLRKVKQASQVRMPAIPLNGFNRVAKPTPPAAPASAPRYTPYQAVVVGSSTGGPRALHTFVEALPADLPVGMLLVQHMPPGFTRSLAARLDEASPIQIKEAQRGDRLRPGLALLAPGNFHMTVRKDGSIDLSQGPQVHGVRPSLDVTLKSAVTAFGGQVIAVIMTGMGADGSEGAALLRQVGGKVIAEHESTCVVYGMPRVVVEAGNADEVVPLPQIASELVRLLYQTPGAVRRRAANG